MALVVYCRVRLGAWGSLLRRSLGTRSILQSSLGAWGSLLRRSLGTWSILQSSLGRVGKLVEEVAWHVGKLVAGESLLSMIWLLLTI
ncbi:hypothetical protein MHH60_16020 [Paenibacillus sp. FSL H7-0716]|uniref:hypothetical protein n=1 Tax=Paenibacillus TaxID=44249 RepID=UPI00118064C1|nr:hypothetical protein [Paenibacillus odorifer]